LLFENPETEYKDRSQEDPGIFYVHPDNWLAYEVFCRCFTQWKVISGMGGVAYQGLDYSGVWIVISSVVKRSQRNRVLEQIQFIETGALSTING